ncbi:MAG TPA: Xaa-Pro peptidase family protein [Paracoccaceae bacterium]|nr:Xaa-Pro peptidase family protein [Paracoccaceae bacterium]
MLHFSEAEFADRARRVRAAMADRDLDALLLFAPEAQYWLTGHDTFGWCFFQCLVVTTERMALLTRSADLRQARLTSNLSDIRVWVDREGMDPTADLLDLLAEFGLAGGRVGWETDTQGLTAWNGARVKARLEGWAELVEASEIMPDLRLTKSAEEIAYVREAAEMADAAWWAGLEAIRPGAHEGDVLAAMQGEVFRRGGDYAGNEFVVGGGEAALLCRYQSGRRPFGAEDQVTLEWAGTAKRYHAALMRTVPIGRARPAHRALFDAGVEALLACEDAMKPGRPMGEVFDAHATTLDAAGFGAARLNACGYALGPSYPPVWMERHMFYEGAATMMGERMVFFLHMILMDDASGCAMCVGRTSLVGPGGAEPLSALPLELTVV